jgi:hypothetical protein
MIETPALIAEARRRTGLYDLGEDSFREPLERVVDSINRETRFSPFGTVAVPEMFIKALTNRLEIEEWYRRHPEIDDEEIVAPLFGVGMPRTGSTLLGSLLALDPDTRWLRPWESLSPCPPPIKGEVDSRIRVAEERFLLFKENSPEVFAMIPFGIDEPVEDYELLYNSFCLDDFYVYAHCPSFLEWLYDSAQDFTFAYRYHKRALKLLQWRCPPKRWSLKRPTHSFMIEGLNKVYPDARFVWTHRDPAKSLPSISRLVEIMGSHYVVEARMGHVAAVQTEYWEVAMRRMMDFQMRNESRVFELHHKDLLVNPAKEVRRIYNWLGWPFDQAKADAITSWQLAHPRQEHSYRAAASRFDESDIRRRFSFYADRYNPR